MMMVKRVGCSASHQSCVLNLIFVVANHTPETNGFMVKRLLPLRSPDGIQYPYAKLHFKRTAVTSGSGVVSMTLIGLQPDARLTVNKSSGSMHLLSY